LTGGPIGRLEAEILLGHVLAVNRAWLFANPDHAVSPSHEADFQELIRRREYGEPIAYLTGSREFWSLPLRVTPDVLIPRPETELLVEIALALIPIDSAWRIADLGTGSGALALAIASERPLCEIHATENSAAALELARENGRRIAPGRVHFHQGSWLEPLTGCFQFIVSNPPYVAQDDPHLTEGDCRFEPHGALTPGRDSMAAIRQIAVDTLHYLEPGGWLAFEHGCEQGKAARELLNGLNYRSVKTWNDLEGRERVTAGQSPDRDRH